LAGLYLVVDLIFQIYLSFGDFTSRIWPLPMAKTLDVVFGLKNKLATARSGNAEINNTVTCKEPGDDRLHGQILPNQ
jgi:hypothetical protein